MAKLNYIYQLSCTDSLTQIYPLERKNNSKKTPTNQYKNFQHNEILLPGARIKSNSFTTRNFYFLPWDFKLLGFLASYIIN